MPGKSFADLDQKDESGVVIQTFNDQSEAIKQRPGQGVIHLVHMQLGDLVRQLKKQISSRCGIGVFTIGRQS